MQPGTRAAQPQRSVHAAIEAALNRAHFTEAEQLLREVDEPVSPQSLLLAGKLEVLRDDAPAAIRILSNRRFADAQLEMQRCVWLGAASARAGEYDAADEYFDAAQSLAQRVRDDRSLAELAMRRARRYAFVDDLEKARKQQQIAVALAASRTQKIEAQHIESFLYGLEGRYALQAASLQRLLEQIDPADEEVTQHSAYATHTLAALARELDLPEALPVVERQLRGGIWPEELNVQRFQSLKALGWSYALRGDYFNAFRSLKKSMAHAPSTAWQAIAATDRAYLARCLNEERWSRQELNEAEELAENIDWRATRGEERVGLLLLAEMFAGLDVGRAAQYMALFRDLGNLHAPLLQYGHDDERLQAQADYSAGVTQLALGNARAGVKLLRQSFEGYDRIGYDWRAGRSALRLFEATGEDAYLHTAAEKLRHYPNSWLAGELRKNAKSKNAMPVLPPMQRRVFEELCRGLPTAQIAKNLGRSEYTIKNHIKLIFKAFGVKSRAALIAYQASVRM
jgi:DNA-binding CsgD family transcriptional regulator